MKGYPQLVLLENKISELSQRQTFIFLKDHLSCRRQAQVSLRKINRAYSCLIIGMMTLSAPDVYLFSYVLVGSQGSGAGHMR